MWTSFLKGLCSQKTIDEITNIYKKNNLAYTFKKFSSAKLISGLIPFLKNDKKNNDDKINFILLKSIGKTTLPNRNKLSLQKLKKMTKTISQY